MVDRFNHGLPLIGELVRSRSRRGADLRLRTLDDPHHRRELLGVFQSGKVLASHEGKIDYSTWREPGLSDGLGNTNVRSCFVRDESSGIEGWVYEAALVFINDEVDRNAYLWEPRENTT